MLPQQNKKTILQFASFALIGAMNTLIDLSVFNLLILAFGIGGTFTYIIWKTISFIVAMINSYFMNSRMTWKKSSKKSMAEFYRFATVTVTVFLISLAVSTVVFKIASNSLNPILSANIGALTAVFVNVIGNWSGYRIFVFKSGNENNQ